MLEHWRGGYWYIQRLGLIGLRGYHVWPTLSTMFENIWFHQAMLLRILSTLSTIHPSDKCQAWFLPQRGGGKGKRRRMRQCKDRNARYVCRTTSKDRKARDVYKATIFSPSFGNQPLVCLEDHFRFFFIRHHVFYTLLTQAGLAQERALAISNFVFYIFDIMLKTG